MLGANPKTVRGPAWVRVASLLVLGVLAACSSDPEGYSSVGSGANACAVDEDQDGYGVGCEKGLDCNDTDPDKHEGCGRCDTPNQGCACEPGTEPTECLTQELLDPDTLLCRAGTRFCRDGAWSECTGVVSFEADVPARSAEVGVSSQALLAPDAGTTSCSPCRPSCFPVEDPLDVVDGGLDPTNSRDVGWVSGGGITLAEGGTSVAEPIVDTSTDCSAKLPADMDCDGVPDELDTRAGRDPSYGTSAKTLTMTLAPGEAKTGRVVLPAFVRAVDLYFLLDSTENQAAVAAGLANAIDTGNFFDDPASVTCADTDFDGLPNDELKSQGIAGNVKCITRDGSFGTGWVREIPFVGPDVNGVSYGDVDEFMFEHVADLGTAPADVRVALASYDIDGNHGGPNAPIQALYALATGAEAYVGWDRSAVPARSCAAGFGYGCFRADALPAVVLFTGEPMYNGPSPASGNLGSGYPVSYPASVTAGQVNAGSYPHYLPVPSTNENDATAYATAGADLGGTAAGSLHDDLLTFTGSTLGMASDYDMAGLGCAGGGADTAPDAALRFDVATAGVLTVSTAGTRFPNVLSIRKEGAMAATPVAAAIGNVLPTGDYGDNPALMPDLSPGEVMTVTGTSLNANTLYPRELLGCYDEVPNDSNDFGPDMVFRFVPTANMRVRFAADGSNYAKSLSLFGTQPLLGDWTLPWGNNDTDLIVSGGTVPLLQNMTGNTVRLVSGFAGAGDARRGLPISTAALPNVASGSLFNAAGCVSEAESARSMLVQFEVSVNSRMRIETSGDADGLAPDFDHIIGLYAGHGAPTTLLDCAQDNLTNRYGETLPRAFIERTLPAGQYTAIVRGRGAADVGDFRLTLRDVAAAPVPLGCHVYDEGVATSFEADLTGGQPYYLVMRGMDATGEGAYSFTLRDVNVGGTYDVCGQDGAGTEFTGDFSPGTYYAVVKGKQPGDAGWYQLTIGKPSLETAADFSDLRSWAATQTELTQAGVRVLGVHTGIQAALIEQMEALASATGALSDTSAPLLEEVDPGSLTLSDDLGHAVVRAVQGLSLGTQMDVSLRLVNAPDAPAPAFETTITAVDLAGDRCAPPVNDVHMDCESGAEPEFSVTIRNPDAPGNVPPNPADPNGGYWLTLELVGDGAYVLEQIPVYVVPSTMPAPPAGYPESGAYWQDFSAQNCVAGERPDWSNLTWSATIPNDTSLRWELCTSPDRSGLGSCTLETLASVTSGGACSVNADCLDGFCQANVCQYAVGPSCVDDDLCGRNGRCVGGTCRWTDLPIDPRALLQGRGDDPWIRVEATLRSSTDRTLAPTVYSWRIEYDCAPSE